MSVFIITPFLWGFGRIKHEPKICPALPSLNVIPFLRENVSCSSKPQARSSMASSMRRICLWFLLLKDMPSWSMGISSAFVAWVQRIFGVDHKMGHYTGDRAQLITSTCNDRIYFSLLKINHKVADAMIKPQISIAAHISYGHQSNTK